MCTVPLLDGKKVFDLAGQFLGSQSRPVVVENKSYSSDGGQYTQYQEFLATAYSATARALRDVGDTGHEFIWVTSHPFKLPKWSVLDSPQEVHEALAAFPKCLGEGHVVDSELVRTVASRVWVLVMNSKQESISLTAKELQQVFTVLPRKESTL